MSDVEACHQPPPPRFPHLFQLGIPKTFKYLRNKAVPPPGFSSPALSPKRISLSAIPVIPVLRSRVGP